MGTHGEHNTMTIQRNPLTGEYAAAGAGAGAGAEKSTGCFLTYVA